MFNTPLLFDVQGKPVHEYSGIAGMLVLILDSFAVDSAHGVVNHPEYAGSQ